MPVVAISDIANIVATKAHTPHEQINPNMRTWNASDIMPYRFTIARMKNITDHTSSGATLLMALYALAESKVLVGTANMKDHHSSDATIAASIGLT